MFREMRRKKQVLSKERTVELLERGTSGVLALLGDEDYPYAVPLSYVYADDKIYFHSAKEGHKVDAVRRGGKASFCVIDKDMIVPEEYTTYFRSAIAFGKVRVIEEEEEKRRAIEILADKYNPTGTTEERDNAIEREFPPLLMFCLDIEHLSGKEAIELVNN